MSVTNSVHLQLVDGHRAEQGQGRVAGPEVIQGDPHRKAADLIDVPCRLIEMAHDRRLGELDADPSRIAAGRSRSASTTAIGSRGQLVGDALHRRRK